jgi:oligopeptide transport system substrate-binding protein
VDKDPETWWTKAAGHNGNGPFKIQSIDQGKKIVFVPNANYWRGKPKLDRIELIYNVDNTVILEAYKKDELDINANVAPEDVAAITADAKLKAEFLRFPAAITTMISFNNSRKPFTDINVRKAFSAGFDREGWVRDVAKGVGKPYTRWIPPGVPGSQPDKPGVPAYDPKAAVKYLVDNGYAAATSTAAAPKVDCAKLGEIKLTYGASPLNHARFQFMAGTYVKVFGCPITLEPLDATVVTAMTKKVETNPQIGRQGWIQDYPHPQNWLSVYWVCGAFSARYGYCNKNLDAMLAKADQELDFAKSLTLYQQAEDLLLADVPGAGANYTENLDLVKPWVIGPKDHTGSSDAEWAGEWGPVWTYDIDLTKVPATYPKQ